MKYSFGLTYNITTLKIEEVNKPVATATNVALAVENEKPVLTVSGTCEFVTQDMLGFAFQSTTGWWSDFYLATPVVSVENGNFTLKIDVSAVDGLANGTYALNVSLKGQNTQLKLTAEGTITCGSKTYTFGSLYNNTTITIADAA